MRQSEYFSIHERAPKKDLFSIEEMAEMRKTNISQADLVVPKKSYKKSIDLGTKNTYEQVPLENVDTHLTVGMMNMIKEEHFEYDSEVE